jgi:amidase
MSLSSSDRAALAGWDAVETAQRVQKKDVTVEEVLDAAISRAEDARGLGAVVEASYERARTLPSSLAREGALWGVPTFVKDMVQIRGVATTWGSSGAGRYISKRTDAFVRRFEATGVAILGKSATSELALMPTTEPLGRSPCCNPWDPSRSAGGSSGGAASLVAAGVVPIAHGVDGGGSIRIPAACCGLVGLKPSRYRLDANGSNLLPVNVACDGILSRSVRDCVAFYAALESRKASRTRLAEAPIRRRLRMGVFVEAPTGTPVDPEVRDAVLAAAGVCEALGHEVERIKCPFDGGVIDDFLQYWCLLAWLQVRTARLTFHWRFDRSKLEPWTRGLAEAFWRRKLEAVGAIRLLRRFSREFVEVTNRYDVLISPTVAKPAPPLGYLPADGPFPDVFERVRSYAAPFTPPYNVAGAPAISLPLGSTATGVPIGVQFGAAPGRDGLLMDLALSIEAERPWNNLAPKERWAAIAVAIAAPLP